MHAIVELVDVENTQSIQSRVAAQRDTGLSPQLDSGELLGDRERDTEREHPTVNNQREWSSSAAFVSEFISNVLH